MKPILLFLFFITFFDAFGQVRYKDEISITFKTGNYVVQSAAFFSEKENSPANRNDGFSLVEAGFLTKTYDEYQKLFPDHECHVSANTWKNWKEHIGQSKPLILANFILFDGETTYGITKYALRDENKEYLVAQVHKKINGQWYFLNQKENMERSDLIMFFTCVQEQFFNSFHKDRTSLVANEKLFSGQHTLKGGSLVNAYYDKYRNGAELFEELNLVFEDRMRVVKQQRSPSALEEYFRKADLRPEELSYLLNLLNASLRGKAISSFSEFTEKPMTQIIEECPNAVIK